MFAAPLEIRELKLLMLFLSSFRKKCLLTTSELNKSCVENNYHWRTRGEVWQKSTAVMLLISYYTSRQRCEFKVLL